jgi:hypothetical protein
MSMNLDAYKTRLKEIMHRFVPKSPNLQPQEGKVDEVFQVYNKYEEAMLGLMQIKDEELDRHKIAAALCCSVLKVRPINPGAHPTTTIEKSANELCAFLLGLQVIEDWWHDQTRKDIPAWEKAIYSHPVQLPKTTISKTGYLDIFANLVKEKTFKHLDIDNTEGFEVRLVFLISHIYFMIENYSFEYYKNSPASSETVHTKST